MAKDKILLEQEMVVEFSKIYKEFYGNGISNDKARELAQNLLNAYRIVYRMPPERAVSA